MEQPTADNVDQWISHYYECPRPDLIPMAIQALRDSGHLGNDNALESLTSFFSLVFRAHPDQVDAWLSQFSDLSDDETQVSPTRYGTPTRSRRTIT